MVTMRFSCQKPNNNKSSFLLIIILCSGRLNMARCVKCEWVEKILDFDDEGWGRASITNMDMTAKNTFSLNIKDKMIRVFKIYLTVKSGSCQFR